MMIVHDTLESFGYPENLIKEYKNWILVLRPEQTTLGSMVLISKFDVFNFHDLSHDSFGELSQIIHEIETITSTLFGYDKINYLMLMMKDPHVHFHVIPRYKNATKYEGSTFFDHTWDSPPEFNKGNRINPEVFRALVDKLQKEFNTGITRQKKYNIAYTTGVFDLFHSGHLNIIKKTKEIAETVIVGVSTDELVQKEKKKTPFIPFNERIEIVNSIVYVDQTIPQNHKDKNKIIKKYGVDVVTVGSDWMGKYPSVDCDIVYFDYTKSTSSTHLQKLITKQLNADRS